MGFVSAEVNRLVCVPTDVVSVCVETELYPLQEHRSAQAISAKIVFVFKHITPYMVLLKIL